MVCILGIGRIGSNHLRRTLSCIPEIDSRGELFNPDCSYTIRRDELEELSRRVGKRFKPSNRGRKALRAIRRWPGVVLDCLFSLRSPEKRITGFKVLTGQLTARQIAREIIGRPHTIIVFLRRRPVDAFISHEKALRLRKWRNVDTTELKIDIDAGNFLKWWRRRDAWYRRLEAECWYRNKPFHHLTYENDITGPPAEAARRFCAVLGSYGLGDFTIPDDQRIKGLQRQDRNEDVADRVSNWPEFRRRLEAMGCLDKAFAPFPHFQPNAWDRLRRWLFTLQRADRRSLYSQTDRAAPDERAPASEPGRSS